jgi:orotate phosphoribosyltransferase
MQRLIEGWDGPAGSRVVIVDDVCTSGASTLKACELAEAAGYRVVATFCVVDREEGGSEAVFQSISVLSSVNGEEIIKWSSL